MDKPFPAYKGEEPYVFVCYSHQDAEQVYADIGLLHADGVNLWYDEGIPGGTSWRGEIAQAIQGASRLLFFISRTSLVSNHCLREVDYALNHDIGIVPVYLEQTPLPPELDLALSRVQALQRSANERYKEQLRQAVEQGEVMRQVRLGYRRNPVGMTLVMVLVLAAGLFAWNRNDPENASVLTGQPGAFDLYLEGMELMQRWDKEGNLESANDLFMQALSLDPEFALGYARLAEAQRLQYVITRSRDILDQAIENSATAMQLNANLAPVQVITGRLQQMQGNYDLAYASLERALAIDPNDAMANQAIGSLYNAMERPEDAITAYEKAIALDPRNLIILDAYANLLYNNDLLDEAAVQWRKVVNLAPDHFSATLNLGSVYDELGNLSEAVVMYERAKALRPTHYLAYANLALVYARAERYEEALAEFDQALALNDADWQVWGNLGFTYDRMTGRENDMQQAFLRAIGLASQDVERDPRDYLTHGYLAIYYAKTGQVDAARERFDNALALSPDSAQLLALGSELFEILGERERAIALGREALARGFPQLQMRMNPELTGIIDSILAP